MHRPHSVEFTFTVGLVLLLLSCSDSPGSDEAGADGAGTGGGDVSTDGLFGPPGSDAGLDAIIEGDTGTGADSAVEDAGADTTRPPRDMSDPDFPGRYEECGFGRPPCADPFQCIDGVCNLACNPDSPDCPEDEECIEAGGFGRSGVCGVVSDVGEDCDEDIANVCEEPLYCGSDGLCHEPDLVEETEGCDGEMVQCEDGMVCYPVGGFGGSDGRCQVDCSDDPTVCAEDEVCIEQRSSAVCLEDCDPDTDSECDDPGYECRRQGGGPGGGGETACFPTTGGVPGEQEFGEACNENDNRCIDGLVCLDERIPGVYCTRTCSSSSPCPTDIDGTVECIDLRFANYCLITCEGGAGCPEGMTCNDLFGTEICSW